MIPDINQDITVAYIRSMIGEIPDPEIPVITIEDLGILRNVEQDGDTFVITITPTYSGCPAMDFISMNIRKRLAETGIENYRLETKLSPAWTTAWMTEKGKQQLREFGIAPPSGNTGEHLQDLHPACPQCHSENTELVNAFGSTACKALFRCRACSEPFDYFKCH